MRRQGQPSGMDCDLLELQQHTSRARLLKAKERHIGHSSNMQDCNNQKSSARGLLSKGGEHKAAAKPINPTGGFRAKLLAAKRRAAFGGGASTTAKAGHVPAPSPSSGGSGSDAASGSGGVSNGSSHQQAPSTKTNTNTCSNKNGGSNKTAGTSTTASVRIGFPSVRRRPSASSTSSRHALPAAATQPTSCVPGAKPAAPQQSNAAAATTVAVAPATAGSSSGARRMEGRCRPYRPPMRVQGDEGGKAATAGTGPGSSSGSGLMLRSLVGCLLPHLATAAIEKAAHVAAAVARRVMAPVAAAAAAVPYRRMEAPVAAAAAAVPCRVMVAPVATAAAVPCGMVAPVATAAAVPCGMVAPVATAAAVPCGMVAPVAGAVAPKLVAFRPPPPPITPVHQHQHQHQQAGPRYVARPAVQPMMGPPVVQATAGAAAVAAPRLLVGAPVKLLMAPQLLQRQQHNIQLANRVACVPYPHPHPAVQPQPVLVHGGMPAPRQPHQQQDQSLQMRMQQLQQAQQMWQAQKKVQEAEARNQRIQEAIQEEEDIVVANVRELMQRFTSGASKPFELIRLKRHLGQGAFGCVDCWEVTERQSATASSAASSSGLAAAASCTATATSSSHTFEAAVKTCALDLEGLAAGGETPHSVEMHAKEAAAVLAVQALDSRHLVKVLGAYVDVLTPGEDVPPRGCGIANLHVGRIVMEVARESLTDVVTGHRVLAHCAAGGAAAAFDADSEDTSGYRLPETAVRVVLASVLLGLRDLHGRARLAHRDLKLDNLLVGTDRLVKITDFGLVTPLDSQGRLVSEVGGRRGTKGYQAPETLARRTFAANERDLPSWPAAKSDIYAVGVIGAALVCGTESGPEMEAFRASGELPPHRHASPALRQLLKGMAAADPAQRLGVEEALAHPALRRALSSERARRFIW
ncbi:hypothetical protein CHLRE_04g217940v5 [Chlamydomonas reinhardtii]|uniref:Protein kinase domain-containing protein n=1 Tax=Chlamydomonas reinhardtii TaxID=3055 RepID=A0A2K3DTI6_CHLRE|nr:uncharacterized protein CHLRE_04g217940v5 [Chlamydomonas reinhardtii]PNW83837.1 hypothetical protein CHLRE_04g217940v5 [Chlamydomonas reinhardtii]